MGDDKIQIRGNDISSSENESEFCTDESGECDNQIKNTQFQVLCFSYNLEVIKQKGYHPKFVIFYVYISVLLIILIELYVYGYGTTWNLLVFPPMLISRTMLGGDVFFRLGKTSQEIEKIQKNPLFCMYQAIWALMGCGGLLASIIIKTPFNSPAFYFTGVYPVFFLAYILVTLTQDKINPPSWLPQYRQPIYPSQAKTRFTLKNIAHEKDELKIYKKLVWVSFVITTMSVDVFSDLYYGVDLIIFYRAKNLFLLVIGIVILFCCLTDLILVAFMATFPNWVSYTSHLIAFIMELPNVILTVVSFWKIYQIGELTEENKIVWELAIFSFLTTALAALIHIMYIIDRWTVHNAILRLQQM